MSDSSKVGRLESWKAIARHLGRSVRTVRRWEQQEGLPVHRLMHQAQASVYAFAPELDAWRSERAQPPKTKSGARRSTSQAAAPGSTTGMKQGAPAPAIAVLPFSFAGPDPGQAWVADGFTEEMINGFSSLQGLRVTSRTSSLALQGTEKDSRAIASALGVSHLLEGGVTGDGSRLRINVRLIDPGRDDHLWSRQFKGTMEAVFDIQERVTRAVVAALKLQLAPDEDRRLGRRDTPRLDDWRRLVQARQEALRWRPDALERARALLEEALDSGDHPELLAALGRVLLQHREAGFDPDGRLLAEAGTLADRAEAFPDRHAGTRVLKGWIAYAHGDLAPAILHLGEALAMDRDDPDALALLSNCLLLTGQLDRAAPVIDHLLAVDPLTPLTLCMPGFLLAMQGRFEESLTHYGAMLERDPGNPVARLFHVWALFAAGRDDQALAAAAAFEPPTDDTIAARVAACFANAHLGTGNGTGLTAEDRRLARDSEMYARLLAEAGALRGDADAAIEWMNHAVDHGFANFPYLAQHDPFFARLPDSAARRALLARVERRWRRFNEGPIHRNT